MSDQMEYRVVGGYADGRVIRGSGADELRVPIPQPITVQRPKVVPFRRGLSIDIATYRRFGHVYWWDGLMGDAYAEIAVSDEVIADAGSSIRSVIRGQLRARLQALDPGKELGRIVWRITRHSNFRSTIRAMVGPRAALFGADIRSRRRSVSHRVSHRAGR